MKILILLCLLVATEGFYCPLIELRTDSTYYNQWDLYVDYVDNVLYIKPLSFYGTGIYSVSLPNWDFSKCAFFYSAKENQTLVNIISSYSSSYEWWNNETEYFAFIKTNDSYRSIAFDLAYPYLCSGFGYRDGSQMIRICPGQKIQPQNAKCIPLINGYQLCDSSCGGSCSGPGPNMCSSSCPNGKVLQPAALGRSYGRCVSTCKDGTYYYSGNNSCLLCSNNCVTCDNSTVYSCLSCAPGYYWNSETQYCYDTCPAGYYGDSHRNCSSCDTACATCSGPRETQCSSCNSGYYLFNNTCSESCPSGYYQDNTTNTCTACNSICATCIGPESSNCTACIIGYYLDVSGLGCGTSCPVGYWLDQVHNNCSQCSAECAVCSGPSNQECASCAVGYFLQPNSTICRSTCPAGFYGRNENNNCLRCPEGCLSCDEWGTCSSCQAGYYLQPTQDRCEVSCPPGTWKNSTFSVCSFCHLDCSECFGPGRRECSACPAGKYLHPQTKECGTDCTDGYYKNFSSNECTTCNSSCATCTDADTCLTCSRGYFKQPNTQTCLDSCPIYGYWHSSGNRSCSPCAEECLACSGPANDDCYLCKANYYMQPFNSTCSSTCPEGYELDSTKNVCRLSTTLLSVGGVIGVAVGGSVLLTSTLVLLVLYIKKAKVYSKLVDSTSRIRETA